MTNETYNVTFNVFLILMDSPILSIDKLLEAFRWRSFDIHQNLKWRERRIIEFCSNDRNSFIEWWKNLIEMK